MGRQHAARYREFLKRLRRAREDAGLTQVDVAKALGRPQSFVSKCESGERRVDVIELEQFARVYRKRLSFFISRSTGRVDFASVSERDLGIVD